jgi:hypothetical protein
MLLALHNANPNDAYNAIANDPKFATLLEQVPVKHPTQFVRSFAYIFICCIIFLVLEDR